VKQEIEITAKMLEKLIKSIPNVVKREHGVFKIGRKRIRLIMRKDKVMVEPVGYFYKTPQQVMEEEFELKDAIESYLRPPRLYFEERHENNRNMLYCILEGAGIKIEFRPKWNELLNGVNRMVFTEYKNARKGRKNKMQHILNALQKISRRAERLYMEVEKS
jgi:hypothetical protein